MVIISVYHLKNFILANKTIDINTVKCYNLRGVKKKTLHTVLNGVRFRGKEY